MTSFRFHAKTTLTASALLLGAAACDKQKEVASEPTPAAATEAGDEAPAEPANDSAGEEKKGLAAETDSPARVGAVAPDFTLSDLDGKAVKLSTFRGKTVVLEWFNPECPFVKAAHTKGPLKDLSDKHVADGQLVWLAINSGAEGRQGYGVDVNRAGVKQFGIEYPVLQDTTGAVGKAYGATNTPHLYIIDKQGVLVYAGAIDNSPDGEGESPQGGTLVNYVTQALTEMAAGKPVSVSKTKAYGCSVKYAK